jgi:hypothetical protein
MWGEDTGALRVKTRANDGLYSAALWTRGNNYGDNWNIAQVKVDSYSAYQLVFEGVVDGTWLGNSA